MIRPEAPHWDTPKDLKRWLLKSVEGLEVAWDKRNVVEMAYVLQRWLGSIGTFSHKSLLLDHNKLNIRQLLAGMISYEGGVWCGGMATCFVGLLQCFPGVYAAKWGYGLRDKNISHVTALVGQKDGRAFIFDAYLGYIYKDAESGELFEFSELLCAIRNKQYDRIIRVDIPLKRPAVTRIGDIGNRFNWCFGGKPPNPVKYTDRWVYYGARVSCNGLFAPGTHNRNRIDAVRGDTPFEHFMLDLILKETRISRWTSKGDGEISSTSFSLMRHLVQGLLK